MYHFLDFEKSISVLEGKIEELRNISSKDGLNIGLEVSKLEEQLENKLIKTYSQLTPWDKVKVARHPLRPHPSEIIKNVFTNWQPLAGDRGFKEDNALLGGVAKLGDVPCVVIGIEKGKTVDKRIFHNFGMVRPEGYRKAQRLINFADKFSLPVITLIDTAGAYPGKGAEERGPAAWHFPSDEAFNGSAHEATFAFGAAKNSHPCFWGRQNSHPHDSCS